MPLALPSLSVASGRLQTIAGNSNVRLNERAASAPPDKSTPRSVGI